MQRMLLKLWTEELWMDSDSKQKCLAEVEEKIDDALLNSKDVEDLHHVMFALTVAKWDTELTNARRDVKQHLEELAIVAGNRDIGKQNANYQEHLHLHQNIDLEDQGPGVQIIEESGQKVHLMIKDHIRRTNPESNHKRNEALHHKRKKRTLHRSRTKILITNDSLVH